MHLVMPKCCELRSVKGASHSAGRGRCERLPCVRRNCAQWGGRAVSQLEAPFSEASSIALLKLSSSWGLKSSMAEREAARFCQ